MELEEVGIRASRWDQGPGSGVSGVSGLAVGEVGVRVATAGKVRVSDLALGGWGQCSCCWERGSVIWRWGRWVSDAYKRQTHGSVADRARRSRACRCVLPGRAVSTASACAQLRHTPPTRMPPLPVSCSFLGADPRLQVLK